MKKLILITAYALIASGASSPNFASATTPGSNEKTENVKDMSGKRTIAQLQPSSDFGEFLKGAQEKVALNERHISALIEELTSENKGDTKSQEATQKMEKNIALLEKYNKELKMNLQQIFLWLTLKSNYME